ncbi:MAG: YebC/PmpR family DNA-binding transcriptional regulator [Flavobacteriales bacterium]|nr:YebC/PmpR family DNA-binding transcriptional regulator [Flavobacteriales bacterium]
MGRAFEFRKARKLKRWSTMAKTFTRIGKDIAVSVREGGPNPESNSRLRAIIQNAKAANMPKENILRAIKNASERNTDNYKEITLEGYGPHGVAVMIDCTTDNNNRTVGNIRSYFNKADGNLGVNGSVEFMFSRYCLFKIKHNNIDLDNLELKLIDYGLEEIIMDESSNEILIYGNYDSFGLIQTEIEKRSIEIISSEFERIPNNYKDLDNSQKNDLEKFLEICENDDDVQKVYHNVREL